MTMAAVLAAVFMFSVAAPMAQAPAACANWQACRDATEQALREARHEEAHDLAWRTVQRGPKDDAALLALLARAQALSGRTDDALVMVRRLVDRGVLVEARTDEAFARVRTRAAWADLEARLLALEQRLAEASSASTPTAPSSPSPSPAPRATVSRADAPARPPVARATPSSAVPPETTAGMRAGEPFAEVGPRTPEPAATAAAPAAPGAAAAAPSRAAAAPATTPTPPADAPAARRAPATPAVGATLEAAASPMPPAASGAPATVAPPRASGVNRAPAEAPPGDNPRESAAAPARARGGPAAASARSASAAAVAPMVTAEEREAVFEERARLSTPPFHLSAMVYDAVSARLLLGDRDGRKVRVLGDGFDAPVDLVRAESAGFGAVMAVDIDRVRGDLWVASAQDAAGAAGGLHRMQLISGRPLQTLAPPAGQQPWHPVAVHVAPTAVITADDQGQLRGASAGAAALRRIATVPGRGRLALAAVPGRDEVVLVASATQVWTVAIYTGRVLEVTSPVEGALVGIEQMAAWSDRVVVVQRKPDGTRHLAQWRLTNRGRQATAVVRYQPALSAGDAAPGLAVTGDEALVAESVAGGAEAPTAIRVRRVRLR